MQRPFSSSHSCLQAFRLVAAYLANPNHDKDFYVWGFSWSIIFQEPPTSLSLL